MATFELDYYDAARLIVTAITVADLVEQEPGTPGHLTDGQVQCLTCPPALAITRDRAEFAANLRASAGALGKQFGDDAPDISRPYAYRRDAKDILCW
jgi:hypothetical protein